VCNDGHDDDDVCCTAVASVNSVRGCKLLTVLFSKFWLLCANSFIVLRRLCFHWHLFVCFLTRSDLNKIWWDDITGPQRKQLGIASNLDHIMIALGYD